MTRALVTGPSRGIGRNVALLAAERGLDVDLLGRPSVGLGVVQSEIMSLGREARVVHCDLARRAQVDQALDELRRGPPPDVVVHNAGFVARASVMEQSDAMWDELLEVNLTSPMRITRALLPGMLQRGSGRIIFISSISAVVGTKEQSGYNACKAAIVAYMRCLAEELSATPLATCALLPGAVDTDMLKGSPFSARMGPQDVARSVLHYALDAPRAHNGAVIEMFGI